MISTEPVTRNATMYMIPNAHSAYFIVHAASPGYAACSVSSVSSTAVCASDTATQLCSTRRKSPSHLLITWFIHQKKNASRPMIQFATHAGSTYKKLSTHTSSQHWLFSENVSHSYVMVYTFMMYLMPKNE